MTIEELIRRQHRFTEGELIEASYSVFRQDIIATSSFGATSGVLIDLVSRLGLPIRFVYINTGFLFRETIEYVEQMKARYAGIEFIELKPSIERDEFLKLFGDSISRTNPDFCCRVNKVEPLNAFMRAEKIKGWLTGLRSSQTSLRDTISPVTQLLNGIYKVSPILRWTTKNVYYYLKEHDIPFHPLYEKGYTSIGCEPCTELPFGGDERSGRWKGIGKTECGLHIDQNDYEI